MKRYKIIRQIRGEDMLSGRPQSLMEADNREDAHGCFETLKANAQPGEEVISFDTQKFSGPENKLLVLEFYYRPTQENILASVEEMLENSLKERNLVEDLVKFADEVKRDVIDEDGDPWNHFSWAGNLFNASARLKVIRELKWRRKGDAERPGLSLEGLHEYALEQVRRGAKWPAHSTSVASNLADEAKTQAFAEWEEKLRQLIEFRDGALKE